ncbi:PREDICTED: abhydrolase domain-containing protein 15 [Calidris pugnax]|uniref:abhydrolase domain-containing protein 15 n=1 Tax=Calidris pugnax TaxID=198806 RepID=UPI00071DC13F|nr:PREDICTED: abhydrolase domain-containing protein 15 [Calidris pugnax]
MVSPEALVALAVVLAGLGLLAWRLWGGRLEKTGDWGEEEEEEEEGIPFIAEDGSRCCRLLCKPSALAQHLVRSLGGSGVLWGGHWRWPCWPRLQMLWQLLKPPEPEPVVARELLQMPDTGYAGSLAEAVDVAGLLGSRSLRELEEALFCQTKSHPTSWETYWERNEPLRDADEVAVPVLCLCGADDPVRGPPSRSLPLELFRSSPYFFLLLTPRGGHCGFPRRGPGCCWAQEAVLEYFRAMVEFLGAEEGKKGLPRPRRWGGPMVEPPIFTWQRSYTR